MLGLAPLWINALLGDIGRHGQSEHYQSWTEKFRERQCILNCTKTQGIIEKHHQSIKQIFLDQKNGRVDQVIRQLYMAKKALHRQYKIQSSGKHSTKREGQKLKQDKLFNSPNEKFKPPKNSGKGYYQSPPLSEVHKTPTLMKSNENECDLPPHWIGLKPLGWGGHIASKVNKSSVIFKNRK